ncbi:MAG: hypothetical protein KDM64_18525 [Verrucomicrobiae bacterium]|nr:hypothetical protein [Verrucomicrobiae bacterium]
MQDLAWVRWLFTDLTRELSQLSLTPAAKTDQPWVTSQLWRSYVMQQFRPRIGPVLRHAWLAAEKGHTRGLRRLSEQLASQERPLAEKKASIAAAGILLRTTRTALHQGPLGKLRAAIQANACPAEWPIVWATLGSIYQLGLANVVGEFLRLEWHFLTRQMPIKPSPARGEFSIAHLVREALEPLALQ